MNRINPARLGLLAAVACAAGWTTGALAQEQSAPPPAHRPWDPMAMRQHMEDRRAARLKALHDALNIRPDQEAAFSAFAAAVSPPAGADGHRHDAKDHRSGGPDDLTTPQRLDRMAQRLDERTSHMKEAFERRAAATKALYAALNPDQQHTMDALHNLMGHDGWRRGAHDGGGHPGPGSDHG